MLKPKSPISLQVELTDTCNHHCLWCYNYFRTDNYKNSKDIDTNRILNIAD